MQDFRHPHHSRPTSAIVEKYPTTMLLSTAKNVNLGVQSDGWRIDWRKFRSYLEAEYDVTKAYLFLGFIPDNTSLYNSLQGAGFTLVFKTVTYQAGKPKGNMDAELVLQAMIDYPKYNRPLSSHQTAISLALCATSWSRKSFCASSRQTAKAAPLS